MFLLKCKEPFLPLNSKTNALIGDINEGLVERVPLHPFSLAADELTCDQASLLFLSGRERNRPDKNKRDA